MSKTKRIAIQGAMLAIMLVFQTMKGISVFITGPIVNIVLITVTYYFGFSSGVLFSVIAPITSFFITPNPILKAVPAIVVFIALGNIVLCLFINLLKNRNLVLNLFVASTLKGLFMTLSISLIIVSIATNSGVLAPPLAAAAKTSFSVIQFATAYIASFISYFVLKYFKFSNLTK